MRLKRFILLGPAHPYRGGIAETQNYLAKNLSNLGYEVLLFTFKFQYPKILFPGKTQYTSKTYPNGIVIKRKVNSVNPFNWIKVTEEINEYNPDVVFFRYWTPFISPCWSSIAYGLSKKIKKVAFVDNWIPHERSYFDNKMNNFFRNKMNAFITLSTSVANEIKLNSSENLIFEGFHPISDDLPEVISRNKARKKLGWSKDKKIVLFFGIIRKYKGLDLLIESFSKSPLKSSNTVLAIVGEPYEKEKKYTKLVQNLNLEERVICDFNYADNYKARDVICAADVIAQTYRSASQSGVTPLAYYYQTPILVSDLPGLKEPILRDGTGIISDKNPKNIAENLKKILEEESLSNYKKQIIKIVKKYDWKSFCKSIVNLLEDIAVIE